MSTCVGFRFRPTDQELIGHFLRLKNNPDWVPESTFPVPEFDLYGEREPWAIWESFGGPNLIDDDDLYFFTRLKKKGRRIHRRIGSGTWSQGEPSKLVFARNEKNPIGRKTKLRYENKAGVPEQHGCWSLDEYSSTTLDDDCFVICRLRENNGKRKCQNVVDDDAQPPRKKAKSGTTLKHLQVQPDEVTANEEQFGYEHAPALSTSSSLAQPNPTDDGVNVFEIEIEDGNFNNAADWLETALLQEDENTLSHALALPAEQPSSSSNLDTQIKANSSVVSEFQKPSTVNEASSSAYEILNIPMDDIYWNSDEFNDYIFGDEFLSGGIHTGTADKSPFSILLGE